jgi:RNA polymerase sigma-70 factor, ECF subfamily
MQTVDPALAALIGRIARKEPAALMELYQATGKLLFGLAWRILGDRTAAEEVVLDVYTKVWKQSASFDDRRHTPLSWIVALTRTRALDRLHFTRHTRKSEAGENSSAEKPDNAQELPASSPQKEQIRTALATLPSEQWSVIELAYYSGLSQNEIAAKLQQPVGAVKTRARLGMIKLSQLLPPILQKVEMENREMEK